MTSRKLNYPLLTGFSGHQCLSISMSFFFFFISSWLWGLYHTPESLWCVWRVGEKKIKTQKIKTPNWKKWGEIYQLHCTTAQRELSHQYISWPRASAIKYPCASCSEKCLTCLQKTSAHWIPEESVRTVCTTSRSITTIYHWRHRKSLAKSLKFTLNLVKHVFAILRHKEAENLTRKLELVPNMWPASVSVTK